MFCAILAFAVLIVPVSAEFLVGGPILPLALYALKSDVSAKKMLNFLDDWRLLQYALPLHFEHLRNFTPASAWPLPQVLHRRRFVMVKKGLVMKKG